MDFKDLLGKGLDEKKTLVMECTQMLEKYLSCFPKETGCASFSGEDMKRWKEEFFPKLVQTGEIIDYHVQIPNHASPDQGDRERGGLSDRVFRYPGCRETQLQDAGIYA